ncbi:MAG: 50S ribosomal protein L29 [Cyanobacteriota bacterium]|nr:50S ribosomal protein L29 [Cyanobacteriota bacterium]
MVLPKIDEVTPLSDEEIAEQILAIKKELFELRLQKVTGQLEKPHLFKHKRHRLGQLLTVERQRQIAAQLETSASETADSAPEPEAAPEPETETETIAAP